MRILASIFFIVAILANLSHAQEAKKEPKKFKKKPAKKERMLISLTADNLIQTSSYYEINPYNSRGVDIAMLYDLIIKKSQFSAALGGGFNSVNIKSNAFPVSYQTIDGGSFTKMDTSFFSDVTLKQSKISLNYIDIPFEIRWRSRSIGKKRKRVGVSVGFKVGFLVQSHTKTTTEEDMVHNGVNLGSKFKTYDIENLNPIKYGVTVRAGFANFYLIGYYGLSQVFKKDMGTPANVISVGIGFSPF